MKKYLLFIFLPLFSLNAQNNTATFHSDDGVYSTTVVSPEYQTKQLSDECSVYFPSEKSKPDNSKNSFHLKITIEGIWGVLALGDGDGFWEMIYESDIQSDVVELTVPEGRHDFCLWCSPDEVHSAFVTKEQILVDKDTEITLKVAEAIHEITVDAVDETGRPFSSKELSRYYVNFLLCMHSSIRIVFEQSIRDTSFRQKPICVNDLGSHFIFSTTLVTSLKEDGTEYCVKLPAIYDGLSKDTVLANRSENLLLHRQMFDLYPPSDGMFTGYALNIARNGGGFLHSSLTTWKKKKFDTSKPYQLYIDSRLDHQDQHVNVFFAPVLYIEKLDLNTGYSPYIAASSIIVSEEEKIVKDDFLMYCNYFYAYPEDYMDIFSRLPLLKQYEAGESIYNDYRTPILYYQGTNTRSYLCGNFLFLGKNNEQRFVDTDCLIEVKRDGVTIFHDSIYIFQHYLHDISSGYITMNVLNDNNFAYGRNMSNQATIGFDLEQSDCNPPSLTMLRVVDANGRIRTGIEDLENAKIELTAGDFDVVILTQVYSAKPTVDISWSLDGEEFYPLEAVEDESKFHKSSGHFFNVELASLRNQNVQDKWITVKITLTDETGNFISQVLEPLFYCGNLLDIEVLSADPIKHSVFPNPFSESVTVELEKPLRVAAYFEVYDMVGRIVHQQKIAEQTASFSWNGGYLKEGFYIYAIYSEEGVAKGKMVKLYK